tara:strand:+ start:7044 stop:8258 length:1215 start_codon:yes stop_codon:yes gene_type:complete
MYYTTYVELTIFLANERAKPMTSTNTITKNVNNEAKTFTAATEGHYANMMHTVSIKSIYDRILTEALGSIESNFTNRVDTLTSDCGRFTFESEICAFRDNKNSNYERVMTGGSIQYRSRILDATKSDDTSWNYNGFSEIDMTVEVAKHAVSDNGRTVYVHPEDHTDQISNWDRDAVPTLVDCTLKYGVVECAGCYHEDKDKSIEVDGVTYYENVWTTTYTRKARITVNGRQFVFTTPEELDAAIETINEMLSDQTYIDAFGKKFDNEEELFNTRVNATLKCEAEWKATADLNDTIMSQVITMLDAAGFEKRENWHRQPAEGVTGGCYNIRMSKDTYMGTCSVSVENFRCEREYCYTSKQHIIRGHEVDFGLTFGRGGSNGTDRISSDDLLIKVERAIEMAELAG